MGNLLAVSSILAWCWDWYRRRRATIRDLLSVWEANYSDGSKLRDSNSLTSDL